MTRYHTKSDSRQIRLCLLESVSDSAARQIVGRHFYADAVAYQNANAVLAHLPGNSCQDDVRTIVQLDFEKCIGLFVDYRALCWDQIISCQIGFSLRDLSFNLHSARPCFFVMKPEHPSN
jgi:hypothetical protein